MHAPLKRFPRTFEPSQDIQIKNRGQLSQAEVAAMMHQAAMFEKEDEVCARARRNVWLHVVLVVLVVLVVVAVLGCVVLCFVFVFCC
jgi:hypothetical protein